MWGRWEGGARDASARLSEIDASTRLSVLLIDDDADLREVLVLLLARFYQVEEAATVERALAMVAARPYDVVLCDVGLPGLDGYEVARRLRADPSASSAILIALTGYAAAADKERAHSAGFDLHLAKPLKVSQFSETLGQLARPAK